MTQVDHIRESQRVLQHLALLDRREAWVRECNLKQRIYDLEERYKQVCYENIRLRARCGEEVGSEVQQVVPKQVSCEG